MYWARLEGCRTRFDGVSGDKWYTELREQIQTRLTYERLRRQSGLEVHRQMFKHQCTVANNCLRQAKHHYYSNKVVEAASNQKKLYDIV